MNRGRPNRHWTKSIPLWVTIGIVLSVIVTTIAASEIVNSQWVTPGADGKLVYKTTPAGDRILDFSTAGYMGGGVALPDVPRKRTVSPSGDKDDTAAIQAAIDEVAALPLADGFRGAVLLAAGNFTCSGTLSIRASGVVLRGSGVNETTIKMVGSRHAAIVIGRGRGRQSSGPTIDDNASEGANSSADPAEFAAAETSVADTYVPCGGTTFAVADAKSFAVGDMVAIRRPTTVAWINFMGMDNLRRDGRPQTWIGQSRSGITERKITALSGNQLTVDIPLSDSYDSTYLDPPGTTVTKIRPASSISQVGIEHLHIQCPPLEIAYGQAPYSAIRISGDDCWVKDVYCEETMNSTAMSGKRITLEQVVVTHTFPNLGASKPTDFSIEGTQILLDRCKITGDNMYFVWTASLYPGPNVLLNCTFRGHGSRVQPHMRWSTGLLVDNCTVPDGGIDFPNRGVAGSGHGWTMGWGVAWNCVASAYVIQNPPGAINWAIGCIGERVQTARYFDTAPTLPEGNFDSHGTPVTPQSLYLAQLAERLGPEAIQKIGYASNSADLFPDKSTPHLAALPQHFDPVLGPNLALHRPINAGNVRDRSRQFGGEKAVDGDDNTYWATNDSATRATLEVDMEGPVEINALTIGEAIGLDNRVQQYKVEGQVDSGWKLLSEGTAIGDHKIDQFPNVTVWKVRLTILKTQSYSGIQEFGLYRAHALPEQVSPSSASETEIARPK